MFVLRSVPDGRKDEPTMPGAERADGPHYISQGDQRYPGCLIFRLDPELPPRPARRLEFDLWSILSNATGIEVLSCRP